MSPLISSRDPYERFSHEFYYPNSSLVTLADEMHFKSEMEYMQTLWKHSCYLCFVMPDEKSHYEGCDRLRMWDQYAEAHHGVCIGIDREQFETNFYNAGSNEENQKMYAAPVEYNHPIKYPVHTFFGIPVVPADEVANFSCAELVENNYGDFFFQKDLDYKDENEYRFLVLSNSEISPIFLQIENCAKEIIFGYQISKDTVNFYKAIINSLFPDVKLYKALWRNGFMIKTNI